MNKKNAAQGMGGGSEGGDMIKTRPLSATLLQVIAA